MKYAICFLVMTGCGLTYVQQKQPALWKQLLVLAGLEQADASNSTAGSSDTVPSKQPITFAPLVPVHPEVITPDSTYMTSEHVHQVAQPPQPGSTPPQTTAATSTPAQ